MRRLDLIGAAAPIGLATGVAAWMLAGGAASRSNTLEAIHQDLARLRPPAAASAGPSAASAAALLGTPLFALTTGPGAVREPSIRIDGVALTARRMAALIAIDGKPAQWLKLGESQEGVTLQAVTNAGATVETALGVKTLGLGEQSADSAPPPGSSAVATATSPDRPPPGFRQPPEPASAPRPR